MILLQRSAGGWFLLLFLLNSCLDLSHNVSGVSTTSTNKPRISLDSVELHREDNVEERQNKQNRWFQILLCCFCCQAHADDEPPPEASHEISHEITGHGMTSGQSSSTAEGNPCRGGHGTTCGQSSSTPGGNPSRGGHGTTSGQSSSTPGGNPSRRGRRQPANTHPTKSPEEKQRQLRKKQHLDYLKNKLENNSLSWTNIYESYKKIPKCLAGDLKQAQKVTEDQNVKETFRRMKEEVVQQYKYNELRQYSFIYTKKGREIKQRAAVNLTTAGCQEVGKFCNTQTHTELYLSRKDIPIEEGEDVYWFTTNSPCLTPSSQNNPSCFDVIVNKCKQWFNLKSNKCYVGFDKFWGFNEYLFQENINKNLPMCNVSDKKGARNEALQNIRENIFLATLADKRFLGNDVNNLGQFLTFAILGRSQYFGNVALDVATG